MTAQIGNVLDRGENRDTEVVGPSAKAPAQAVAGFARKHGIAVEQLERRETPKGDFFLARIMIKGAALDAALAEIVEQALKNLPIPKMMRWGAGEAQFVRPVHGLVMLHGRRVVPGSVLGLKAGNVTRGHRFMGAAEIALRNAEEYEERLLKDGAVIADFARRRHDARFFYNQDRKLRLEHRVPQLARVVYHNQLGTQLERVERLQLLAGSIARALKADALLAERAAWLSKADLLTGMVGEFPELQGFMGRYYALHDGEPREVADAIEAHYRPRFAGDRLPETPIACAVALADKLDALSGLFSIGQAPTGERDPFGLRRAALGVVHILVERGLELSLFVLVKREAGASFVLSG